jgi:hypothetical protein
MRLLQLLRGLWRARERIVRAALELSAAILEIHLSALTAGEGIHRGTKPCGCQHSAPVNWPLLHQWDVLQGRQVYAASLAASSRLVGGTTGARRGI